MRSPETWCSPPTAMVTGSAGAGDILRCYSNPPVIRGRARALIHLMNRSLSVRLRVLRIAAAFTAAFTGALIVTFAAAPDARADALFAVQVLREGGCGGAVPAARALHRDRLLDLSAAEWAAGRPLLTATQRSGYRAKSTAGWHVTGPDSSLVQLLRRSDCRKIANPTLRDIGIYHRGEDTWLVLATAFAVPVSAQPTALAERALKLVNEVRAAGTRCGARRFAPAPPLTLSDTLGGVALGHASDMAQHDYFEHVDLTGRSPADRVRAVGYPEKLVGENIAYGPETVEEVVKGWLGSPEHCENIMDARFAQMGLGYAAGEAGGRRGLYWDQLLAAPRD